MTFWYKLEFSYDNENPADAGVYLHMRVMPPTTRRQTRKEDYDSLPAEEQHDFLTGIFNTPGVEEVSCLAYRLWIMKSPIYTWAEVNTGVLLFVMNWMTETTMTPLEGSANIDGSGFILDSPRNRRER